MIFRKVFADTPAGQRVTMGPSMVTPICEECGAVLFDELAHDEWHDVLNALIVAAALTPQGDTK